MRPTSLRAARPRAIAGALLITAPAAAAEGAAPVSTPAPHAIAVASAPRSVRAGEPLAVRATAPTALAGHLARLEQQTAGGPWRSLAQAPVGPGGQVRFAAPAERSGVLRVSVVAVGVVDQTRTGARAASAAPSVSSAPVFVAVGARLQVGARRLSVLAGQAAWIHGRVLPATSGRRVVLEAIGVHGGWHQIAGGRSDRGGRYRLAVTRGSAGVSRVRVRFPGDGQNAPAVRPLRPLEVFRAASVSTYGGSDGLDGSPLACGGTLSSSTLGVADRTLPCGTRITLRYAGHEVRVPVVDRGPYVGDREYDLTSATAARLGVSGTGDVWTTG